MIFCHSQEVILAAQLHPHEPQIFQTKILVGCREPLGRLVLVLINMVLGEDAEHLLNPVREIIEELLLPYNGHVSVGGVAQTRQSSGPLGLGVKEDLVITRLAFQRNKGIKILRSSHILKQAIKSTDFYLTNLLCWNKSNELSHKEIELKLPSNDISLQGIFRVEPRA